MGSDHQSHGRGCNLIRVDLPNRKVNLLDDIEFEPGTANLKAECNSLMGQLRIAIRAIDMTCVEFPEAPRMNFRVEGHTAPSAKSKDGGKKTSAQRAKAVVNSVCRDVADNDLKEILWPKGFGSRIPPEDPEDDPRRVEVHVMTVEVLSRKYASKLSVCAHVCALCRFRKQWWPPGVFKTTKTTRLRFSGATT